MALTDRGHYDNKVYADGSTSFGGSHRRHLTTYASQYGNLPYSSHDHTDHDLLPLLLKKQAAGSLPRLWRETLHTYRQPDCEQTATPNGDCWADDRFKHTRSYPHHLQHKTRHASRFLKLRAPVDLAIPPQQLDRDPAVVFSRHLPNLSERRLSTANFYTAVTRREASGSPSLTFDALNRQLVPVPQLMDKDSPKATAYEKVSITPWKDQVTKVVPERIPVSIPASGSKAANESECTFRLDYLKMPETTFLPVDRAQTKRHYVINPEWCSERPNMNFIKPGHGPLSW